MERIINWLEGFAGMGAVCIDTLGPQPGSCGLYPVGLEQLDRREDVLGNRTVRWRQSFLLRRVAARNEDAARWLLDFQNWVANQSELGLAPFETLRAEKGKLLRSDQTGTATYEVRLTGEFTKYYEGE